MRPQVHTGILANSASLKSITRRGGLRMAEYMAYSVGPDGYQIAFKALDCADDVEAAEKAKHLVEGHDIELWCGDRFVIRIDRKPK